MLKESSNVDILFNNCYLKVRNLCGHDTIRILSFHKEKLRTGPNKSFFFREESGQIREHNFMIVKF